MAWDGKERRLSDKLLDKSDDDLSVSNIAKILRDLSNNIAELRKDFDQHTKLEIEFRDSVYNAFPERDFQDHHTFHKERRETRQQNKEILSEGKKKVFSGVIWGSFLLLGYGVIEWLKKQLNS